MKIYTRLVSATILAMGVIAPLGFIAAPALAAKAEPAKPAGPQFKLSKPVQKLLFDSQKLSTASDFPGALAKVNEAAALPGLTNDEIYMINAISINIAIGSKDNALLEKALIGALSTGLVGVDDQPKFLRNLGAMAVQRSDYAGATTQFEKLVAMQPGDVETLVTLGELSQRQRQPARAVAWLTKAVDASTAKGVTASEDVYRRRLAIAYDAKLAAESLSAAKAMVTAYPNPINWRDALTIFRDSSKLDDQTSLDVLRLMQTVGSLNGERDFAEYAETAVNRGLPGEARLALDDGIAKGMLTPTKQFVKEISTVVNPKLAGDKASLPGLAKDAAKSPTGKLARVTGDAMYGYAQYAEAAAMYRLALSKGGADVDVDQANLRLGMVLARAGDKAGATAAFDALKTPGARQTIGQYWLIWLNRKV